MLSFINLFYLLAKHFNNSLASGKECLGWTLPTAETSLVFS
jgi:hypothetical protein